MWPLKIYLALKMVTRVGLRGDFLNDFHHLVSIFVYVSGHHLDERGMDSMHVPKNNKQFG